MPQHTSSLTRPNHPFFRGFLALEAVHVESELASHGPTILGIVVKVSKDPCCFCRIRVFTLLQTRRHHWRRTNLSALYHSRPFHVVLGPFGWCGLSARTFVNLLPEGIGQGALSEPPALNVDGFFGVFFWLASAVTLLYLEMFNARVVNFLAIQCWLRTNFVKRPSKLKCLALAITLMFAYT